MAATARSMFASAEREVNDRPDLDPVSNETKPDIMRILAGTKWEFAMAKGQLRSTKEKKKPKAEWNKKKKGGPVPTPSLVGQIQSASGQSPFNKKT